MWTWSRMFPCPPTFRRSLNFPRLLKRLFTCAAPGYWSRSSFHSGLNCGGHTDSSTVFFMLWHRLLLLLQQNKWDVPQVSCISSLMRWTSHHVSDRRKMLKTQTVWGTAGTESCDELRAGNTVQVTEYLRYCMCSRLNVDPLLCEFESDWIKAFENED